MNSSIGITRGGFVGLFGTAATIGLVAAALGPLIPLIREKYSVSIPASGLTFLLFSGASLIGAFIALFLVANIQARVGLGVALTALALGLLGIGLSPSFESFLAAAALAGLGFGYLDVAINQVVGLGGGERTPVLLLIMNSLFGVGAIIGPLVVAGAGLAALPFVMAVIATLSVAFIAPYWKLRGYVRNDPGNSRSSASQKKLLILVAVGYFFYIGVEAGVAGWLSTHLVATGWSTDTAAASAAVFWFAFTVGRLLVIPLTKRMSPALLTAASMSLTLPALFIATLPNLTLLGYLLVGMSCAPVFPLGIAWIAEKLPGNPRATGSLVLVVMTGASLLPFATGVVLGEVGAVYASVVLAVPAALSSVAFWFGRRLSSSNKLAINAIDGGSHRPPTGSQSASGRD